MPRKDDGSYQEIGESWMAGRAEEGIVIQDLLTMVSTIKAATSPAMSRLVHPQASSAVFFSWRCRRVPVTMQHRISTTPVSSRRLACSNMTMAWRVHLAGGSRSVPKNAPMSSASSKPTRSAKISETRMACAQVERRKAFGMVSAILLVSAVAAYVAPILTDCPIRFVRTAEAFFRVGQGCLNGASPSPGVFRRRVSSPTRQQ